MTIAESKKRESIVDSPWYWAYVFIAAALAILFVAQGRIRSRQAQIETKYQGRQRAVRALSGQQPATPLSTPSNTLVQLWPLFVTLTLLLCITGFGLSRRWRNGADRDENAHAHGQNLPSLGSAEKVGES